MIPVNVPMKQIMIKMVCGIVRTTDVVGIRIAKKSHHLPNKTQVQVLVCRIVQTVNVILMTVVAACVNVMKAKHVTTKINVCQKRRVRILAHLPAPSAVRSAVKIAGVAVRAKCVKKAPASKIRAVFRRVTVAVT